MQHIRLKFLACSAVALGLAACATSHPVAVPAQIQVIVPGDKGIETAQRALPTISNNVSQPAHYQHVYIDTADAKAGSLQTISLVDAVKHNVLASSETKAKSLSQINPADLKWIVFDKGFARPSEIEGIGGADALPHNFSEVNFAHNKTEILNPPSLDKLVKLASRVGGMFYIVGYTDETGDEAQNLTLSQERAKVVYDALVVAGVNPTRIKESGAGVSRIYYGLDANRRATVTFNISQ